MTKTVRTTMGLSALLFFIVIGYGPAMFCRDLILLGYSNPASHTELVRYVAAVSVGMTSMGFYALFAWLTVLPLARSKFPDQARMTGDQRRDVNDKRFFYCLIPWLFIVAGYALWDMSDGMPAPGSETVMQWARHIIEKLI